MHHAKSRQKFPNARSLLNPLHKITIELPFENPNKNHKNCDR